MFQIPETAPPPCLSVSEHTRFPHTEVCGPSPTDCPDALCIPIRDTRNLFTDENRLSPPLEHTHSEIHTHTVGFSLSHTLLVSKHTPAYSPAEVPQSGLQRARMLLGEGVVSSPHSHHRPSSGPQPELEMAMVRNALPGPWGHQGWGGTKECPWHVLTGDFIAWLGRLRKDLGEAAEGPHTGSKQCLHAAADCWTQSSWCSLSACEWVRGR